MKIEVTTLGSAEPGEFIAAAEDESYPVGTIVPFEDYEADDQLWAQVLQFGGPAQAGWVELIQPDGTVVREARSWGSIVWRQVSDEGEPVWLEVQP